MPVFRSGDTPPAWCGLRYFEIVHLAPGESRELERRTAQERLVVGVGACQVEVPRGSGARETVAAAEKGRGEFTFALNGPEERFRVTAAGGPATLIRFGGEWEAESGFGVFVPRPAEGQSDRGDPVSYPKFTSFDNHFHDCDEYWIVFQGRGVAYSEGNRYEVGVGDCVATGMGHHHDFPEVHEPVRAVFFETAPEGQRRPRHLWEHTHGRAEPQRERI